MDIVIALATSFLGSLGFGIILHAPRAALFQAALIGSVSYIIYWGMLRFGVAAPLAMFCGAAAGSLLGQLAARRMRVIATVFITIAIIPLVPGLGLYGMMQHLAQGETAAGAAVGVRALLDFLMIALGIGVGSFVFRIKWRGNGHEHPPAKGAA